MKSSKIDLAIFLIAIISISYFSIFKNLDAPQIRMWDEATYANNAIDFYENGNFVSVTHLGKTDWYNTKPPFVIWAQGLAMKFWGVNEFSVRIPSAIFGFLTTLMVFVFCWQVFKNKIIGYFASIILLTSQGYITDHVVLTGDLDSSLVFWLNLGLFTFIYLVIIKPQKKEYGYIFFTISLIFGFLSKGIAGYFFLPAIAIIYLISNKFLVFSEKKFYYSIIFALLFCMGYYFVREIQTPGYLKIVWDSEIMRYGDSVMSWHIHPFDYYYQRLINSNFIPFIYIMIFALPVVFLIYRDNTKFKILIYLLITAFWYFLLISLPSVKLEWYDAPLYPLLAVIVAFIFFELGNFILIKINGKLTCKNKSIIISIFGSLLLINPFIQILEKNKFPEESIYSMEFEGAYVKYIVEHKPEIKELTVYKIEKNIEHFDQILFYKRAYEIHGKLKIKISEKLDFVPGELVMVTKEEDKKIIFNTFNGEFINQWHSGVIYRILARN